MLRHEVKPVPLDKERPLLILEFTNGQLCYPCCDRMLKALMITDGKLHPIVHCGWCGAIRHEVKLPFRLWDWSNTHLNFMWNGEKKTIEEEMVMKLDLLNVINPSDPKVKYLLKTKGE